VRQPKPTIYNELVGVAKVVDSGNFIIAFKYPNVNTDPDVDLLVSKFDGMVF